jgi:uncharacterized protein YjeT (DUF2065 family)
VITAILPGHGLVVVLSCILAVLALRMADETAHRPRNHLIIIGGALLAFGAVYRLADVLANIEQPRWSAVIGALGVLAFLAADQQVAARYSRAWQLLSGRGRAYTGPDRRRAPRPGTEPDEDHPRDGSP